MSVNILIMDASIIKSQKSLILVIILLIGIAVTVILVQRTQIFRSKATSDTTEVVDVNDATGGNVEFKEGRFKVHSKDVTISVKNLQQLKQSP